MRLTLQEVDALKLQNLSKAFCEIKTIILPPNSSNILSKGRYMHVPSDIKNIRGFLSAYLGSCGFMLAFVSALYAG